jgi:phospholipase/carboxylesterase
MDEYQASVEVEASEFDVIGFSQGAAISSVLAFLYPQRIRKIGILSGFVPEGVDEYIASRPLAGKTVFVAHGTQDDTVPVDRARTSMEILENAGAEITYCEDEVGHKVSLNCMRALRAYLQHES